VGISAGSSSSGIIRFFARERNVLRCVFTKQDDVLQPSRFVKPAESFAEGCNFDALWNDGVLTVHEGKRELLRMTLTLIEKEKVAFDTNGEAPIVNRVVTVDGERNFVKNLAPRVIGTTWEAEVELELQDGEPLYGLGQGEDGVYNRASQTYYMYQHNMRIPMPFVLSPNGWALFFDCGCLMKLDHSRITLDAVQQLDFYIITGTPDECIAAYRKITGKAAMLPKWAFGYIQSREAYRSQQELLDIAAEYRKREIPLDCIVQDWNTWVPGNWGEKVLDLSRYPDMAAASEKLHEENIHTLVSVWPNMNSGTKDMLEMEQTGGVLYDLATYNAFDEEARALYWKQMNEGLFSKGFDGWWCDSTEPFSGPDWGGSTRRSEEERYALVGNEHKQYLGQELANTYALYHAMGIFENQRKEAPERRVVNLTRSGWAGIQNYGTILWSGDICARWDVMRDQIAEGLNMSMSGHPYWTFDIGGFFVVNTAWQKRGCGCNTNPDPMWFWQGGYNDGVEDPAYRELYVRWAQLGCFMPVFRSHGTDTPREIWNFGEPGTPYYDAIADAIRLRYSLMPYIYSTVGMTVLKDETILRPVFFEFADAESAHTTESFFFGKSLLVCPVTEAMQDGDDVFCWPCRLPAGTDWYDWYSGKRYPGGETVEVLAPLNHVPLFVKAGSVIPTAEGLQYAAQKPQGPVKLRIYPGADGTFTYYDDAGDGFGYEKGEYITFDMRWDDKDRTLTLGAGKGSMKVDVLEFAVVLGDKQTCVSYTGEEIVLSF